MSTPNISPTRVSVYKTLTIFPCAVADRWSQSWRGVICVIFLLSLGTIAACAPAQSSPGFIFPCWFISWVWSLSFLHLLLLFLLLLFLNALAFIFSVTRSFSLPEFSFFHLGHVSPCRAWAVLRGGLAALCLVSQLSVWSRGALLRRLGLRRCECDSKLF